MRYGIDHVFRQYDIRGVVGEQLDSDFVYRLGRSMGTYCLDRGARTLSIGRDARLSSPGFRDALAQGLLECGCDVIDIGMVPTPLLYFSLFSLPVDGGVMITGSHNPKDYNGFKICVGRSTIYGDEIQHIKEIMRGGRYAAGSGSLFQKDIAGEHIDHVASQVSKGHRDVRVVVDAGNGVGEW